MMEHAFYKFGRSVLALIAFITVLLTGTLPVMAGKHCRGADLAG